MHSHRCVVLTTHLDGATSTRDYITTIDGMVELGADREKVMSQAALGGHIEIVELMLSLNANAYNRALSEAALGGHQEIVDLLRTYLE